MNLCWFLVPVWYWFWFCPSLQELPSGVLSDLQDSHAAFFLRCAELSQRVLKLMAHGLDLDPDVFVKAHHLVGSRSFPWRSSEPLQALMVPLCLCSQGERNHVALTLLPPRRQQQVQTGPAALRRTLGLRQHHAALPGLRRPAGTSPQRTHTHVSPWC